MIIDIDNPGSVRKAVKKISGNWFDIDCVYFELKADGKTNNLNFWNITDYLLDSVSKILGSKRDDFLEKWNQECLIIGLNIMGYHCTRHSAAGIFEDKGILPLSEDLLESLLPEQFIANNKDKLLERILKYRLERGPGPYFFLSYKAAKDPNNTFCKQGAEILLGYPNRSTDQINKESVPLIIHCAIPYWLLPDKDKSYYVFCILKAYFNFIEPEDIKNNLFEGYSVDLRGIALDPRYIIEVEEL